MVENLANVIDGPKLTIMFTPKFVMIEGDAPREIAAEISLALGVIFKRHDLGLHLSVRSLPSVFGTPDEKKSAKKSAMRPESVVRSMRPAARTARQARRSRSG